jgi:hypothetical protein
MESWKNSRELPGYAVSTEGRLLNLKRGEFLYGRKKVYVEVNTTHKRISMHRLVALAHVPNPLGLKYVDHINRITDDNRACNLRWVSMRQNQWNRGANKNSTSQYKGVFKTRGVWRVKIFIEGKAHWLGTFKVEEDGARAYDRMAKIHHGEYSCLNLVE